MHPNKKVLNAYLYSHNSLSSPLANNGMPMQEAARRRRGEFIIPTKLQRE